MVESECFAPGEHDSVSAGLLASVFELELEPVRQWARSGQKFVRMSWGPGHGAIARFRTRLVVTEDTGAYVRFTHGLEMELDLYRYVGNMERPRAPNAVYIPSSNHEVDMDKLLLDPRRHETVPPVKEHTSLHPPSGICDSHCQPKWLSHTISPTQFSSSSNQPLMANQHPQPSPEHELSDDNQLGVAVNRQLLDEMLYRERREAELEFRNNGDMTAARALLPPSMDGAHSRSESGSPWLWNEDVRRWYWVDKNWRVWWHPSLG